MIRPLRVARGDVSRHAFVKSEFGKQPERCGQSPFAVPPFFFQCREFWRSREWRSFYWCAGHRHLALRKIPRSIALQAPRRRNLILSKASRPGISMPLHRTARALSHRCKNRETRRVLHASAQLRQSCARRHQSWPLDSIGAHQRHIVLAQEVYEFRDAKTLVSDFQRVAQLQLHTRTHIRAFGQPFIMAACDRRSLLRVARKQCEKVFQLVCIKTEVRRQLPEKRAKLVAQPKNAGGKEIGQRSLGIFQSLHVCDGPRALYREHEVLGRGRGPGREVFWSLQRIECAVDFDRAKSVGSVFEFATVLQTFGIENAPPPFVPPAGNANPYVSSRGRIRLRPMCDRL